VISKLTLPNPSAFLSGLTKEWGQSQLPEVIKNDSRMENS
jgi:hypothetical protein